MKRVITAADDNKSRDDAINDVLDNLDSDFDYLIDGLNKLNRDGRSIDEILSIANGVRNSLQSAIDDIASKI